MPVSEIKPPGRTLNVFDLRDALVQEYSDYLQSFLEIRDERIREKVDQELKAGRLWPEPLIQMNPSFAPGAWVDDLVKAGRLHQLCGKIFRRKPGPEDSGSPVRLHQHQVEALDAAQAREPYIVTTGTGSGKSLTYIVPIVDHVLRRGPGKGIQAIVIYPMNALANSQKGELEKFLVNGFPGGKPPVRFSRYTGQESQEERRAIWQDPPDILLTNYVMMELLLTRPEERAVIEAARGLGFLVLDELHTYRGRQGADVAMLVRRVRDRCASPDLLCVGTSATLVGDEEGGRPEEQVAGFASRLFGVTVKPERVVGETLRRVAAAEPEPEALTEQVKALAANGDDGASIAFADFVAEPMSAWLERTFGVLDDPKTGRLKRAVPRSLRDAAPDLAERTGVPEDLCIRAIERQLLRAYRCDGDPETGAIPFAFRIHQFFSRGEAVYATLEAPSERALTLHKQRFVPGDRSRALFPVVFCRQCGQEYYSVRWVRSEDGGSGRIEPREYLDRHDQGSGEAGYLFSSEENPWPIDAAAVVERLPEDWVEERGGRTVVKSDKKSHLPREMHLASTGEQDAGGLAVHFVPSPFPFCLHCGIAYGGHQRSDAGKLTALDTGGRSTATSILSLSVLRHLYREGTLEEEARKLLSFTDNRQDASLQAGHFNDFVEVSLIRSGLWRATTAAGTAGLGHEELVPKVFDALDLPLDLYALDPAVRFHALEQTRRALREVLGYRLYRDLKRGWRVTSPNLEQCGLLEIRYSSLEELADAQDIWAPLHPALAGATPAKRCEAAKVLLDHLRTELAVRVDYLEADYQERLVQLSSQHLRAPWSLDEDENLERGLVAYPRSRTPNTRTAALWLSARGGLGRYLRRPSTLGHGAPLKVDDAQRIVRDLLLALKEAGIVVEVVAAPKGDPDGVPGYQLAASAMRWIAGDGTAARHDPLRVTLTREFRKRPNPYFVELYQRVAGEVKNFRAAEHTAQVPYERRLQREDEFGRAVLPLLFCSPTMELGVDIRELNVVGLRNVPPTPANYAQRSGRAGRSGRPALVFTYCSSGSAHDQHFFRRPERMVAGAVSLPRIDLTNEDLVRSHVQAVWLSETGVSLRSSLRDLLDVEGEAPSLRVLDSVWDQLRDSQAAKRARERGQRILESLGPDLERAAWYHPEWLDRVLRAAPANLDAACGRWRDLFRAARRQMDEQHRVMSDTSRPEADKREAKRLYHEAFSQLNLLLDAKDGLHSDFYSYRYFAGEGVLPGYNFPRLPLSAFLPGRKNQEDFLSRPRFLAISEFGPRAIVYHEGSRYRIHRVLLPVGDDPRTSQARLCPHCGYLHRVGVSGGPDLCEHCRAALGERLTRLLPLQNVSTQRRDRIHSDEEERQRLGYELRTALRFPTRDGRPTALQGMLQGADGDLAQLSYAQAATLWRINMGWVRRQKGTPPGFMLDMERGVWTTNELDPSDSDTSVVNRRRVERVIPYVEDRRNSLLVRPEEELGRAELVTLLWALKSAVQLRYQLEDSELAAELLPRGEQPRTLLLYEAAEGGAGVLQRLVESPTALAQVARAALEICHFDPDTGEDLGASGGGGEGCEAACYHCLLNYGNQRDHEDLDRQKIRNLLLQWARAELEASPAAVSREEHLERLLARCESDLERKFLQFLAEGGYHLPTEAQVTLPDCGTRPDFLYRRADYPAAIYVDGPLHEYPDRARRDAEQAMRMEDLGYTVLRFQDFSRVAEAPPPEWLAAVRKCPELFGEGQERAEAVPERLDLDLFESDWHPLIGRVAEVPGLRVEPGSDLVLANRVVGAYFAEVARDGQRLRLVDSRQPDAERVREASEAEGVPARLAMPDEGDLVEKIQTDLEGAGSR